MKVLDFKKLQRPVTDRFRALTQLDLFCVDVDGDKLWETYLGAFPPGTNPIFRERTEHDCTCCRRFVKTVGGVVGILDGEIKTIWDTVEGEPAYEAVAKAMAQLVRSAAIKGPFLHSERSVGMEKNFGEVEGKSVAFNHFHVDIPHGRNTGKSFYLPGEQIATKLGEMRSTRDVFLRSLRTLTVDALETVADLIANKSLYRGEEQNFVVTEFLKLKRRFEALSEEQQELFAWSAYDKVPASVAKIRNTAIGTLLIDLSEDVDLEQAVRKFETSVMAPSNYKRPTALVSKAMVEKAREKVSELGIADAFERRHARLSDISVNDILFADRDARKVMTDDVFDQVATISSKPKNLDKVETVPVEVFVKDILPRIESMEVMLENRHTGNLVSLIAPQHRSSKPIFKWGNRFSWTYNGEVTDSIKERVKRAGGNVAGDLCCRLAWSNFDDLDLHMIEHGNGRAGSHFEIFYATKGTTSPSGGNLDVDMNAGGGRTREPVENIFYGQRRRIREGNYTLYVHQYQQRELTDPGFEVEIDWLGEVRTFRHDRPVRQGERVEVAVMRYTHAAGIEFLSSLPSTQTSRSVWDLKTQNFHRVTTMMLSPNHWGDGNGSGNKHYFFMLDGCINEGQPRGFFNEYLIDELTPHRKVIEIVGGKSKVEAGHHVDQLSGLGFSSTQRNDLLVRAKGSFTRTIKVQF